MTAAHPWRWSELQPCPAALNGHGCEENTFYGAHQTPHHWYTVWTHPNQHGSYPNYPVMWNAVGGPPK